MVFFGHHIHCSVGRHNQRKTVSARRNDEDLLDLFDSPRTSLDVISPG